MSIITLLNTHAIQRAQEKAAQAMDNTPLPALKNG